MPDLEKQAGLGQRDSRESLTWCFLKGADATVRIIAAVGMGMNILTPIKRIARSHSARRFRSLVSDRKTARYQGAKRPCTPGGVGPCYVDALAEGFSVNRQR